MHRLMQITHQVNYPTHERWRQQCDDVGAHAIACDEILIRASANTARFESFMDRRETFFPRNERVDHFDFPSRFRGFGR